MRRSSSTDSSFSGAEKRHRLVRLAAWATVVSLAVLLLGVAFFAVLGSRMAFLRGATLALNASPASYDLPAAAEVTGDPLDAVISIPTPPMDVPWWSPAEIVDPDALARYTLHDGAGNCAAKSRGLGWWLQGRGIPYRFVYLLSDPGIRHGEGHTMVETAWKQDGKAFVGLLDPLAAGIPIADGVPLDSSRLMADRGGASVRYWPERPDLEALKLRFLVQVAPTAGGRSFVAFSPGSEVNAHLRFMKRLSMVLPDSFASRAAGMSASLFFGIYPRTYVPPAESMQISGILWVDVVMARTVVWSARASVAFGLIWLVGWVYSRRR